MIRDLWETQCVVCKGPLHPVGRTCQNRGCTLGEPDNGLHPAPDQADELQLAKDYLHDGLSYVLQGRRDLAITALADAAHRMSNDPEIRTLADRIVRANGT